MNLKYFQFEALYASWLKTRDRLNTQRSIPIFLLKKIGNWNVTNLKKICNNLRHFLHSIFIRISIIQFYSWKNHLDNVDKIYLVLEKYALHLMHPLFLKIFIVRRIIYGCIITCIFSMLHVYSKYRTFELQTLFVSVHVYLLPMPILQYARPVVTFSLSYTCLLNNAGTRVTHKADS